MVCDFYLCVFCACGNLERNLLAVFICYNCLLFLVFNLNFYCLTSIVNNVRNSDVRVCLVTDCYRILVTAHNSVACYKCSVKLVSVANLNVSIVIELNDTVFNSSESVGNYESFAIFQVNSLIAKRCCDFVIAILYKICTNKCFCDLVLDFLLLITHAGCCESSCCGCHVVVKVISYAVVDYGAVVIVLNHVFFTNLAVGDFIFGILAESCKDSVVGFVFYKLLALFKSSAKVFIFNHDVVKSIHKSAECCLINCRVLTKVILFCECIVSTSGESEKNSDEKKNCCDNSLFHCFSFLFLKNLFQLCTAEFTSNISIIYKRVSA